MNKLNGNMPADCSSPELPRGPDLKLLVFDMGHVFVDFDWNVVCQGFRSRTKLSEDEFRQVLAHIGSLGYELGRITTADFLHEFNVKSGTSLTLEEFTLLWNATFHENEEMAELLQELRKQLPLYLLSNTNESHFGWLEQTFNVSRHFTEQILSFQVGSAKPAQRIYEEVLMRSGRKAHECLFVDDLEHNVQAATNLGMQAIRFTGITGLKRNLAVRGLAV